MVVGRGALIGHGALNCYWLGALASCFCFAYTADFGISCIYQWKLSPEEQQTHTQVGDKATIMEDEHNRPLDGLGHEDYIYKNKLKANSLKDAANKELRNSRGTMQVAKKL
eukprot:gene10995-3067_t